jgi:hypothetical protein
MGIAHLPPEGAILDAFGIECDIVAAAPILDAEGIECEILYGSNGQRPGNRWASPIGYEPSASRVWVWALPIPDQCLWGFASYGP